MLTTVLKRVLHRYDRYRFGGATEASQLPALDAPLPSAPISPDWILEGTPAASAQLLTRSADGGLATGVWECTPGRFRWYFGCDEVIVVLRGEGRVQVGDVEHALTPGATLYFPVGTESVWEIHATLRKHFTHRFPTPLAQRLLTLQR